MGDTTRKGRAVHAVADPEVGTLTVCGRLAAGLERTEDAGAVTCKRCLRYGDDRKATPGHPAPAAVKRDRRVHVDSGSDTAVTACGRATWAGNKRVLQTTPTVERATCEQCREEVRHG